MADIKLTTDAIEIRIGFSDDGDWLAVGEKIPFLACGHGDETAAFARVSTLVSEFFAAVTTQSGPDKLTDYLTARDVSYTIERNGMHTSRQTMKLPELALSGV